MFTIAIQAGGESTRMGSDKGLVPFLGKPLVKRVVERMSLIAREILVTTNRPEDYQFLGVRLVSDIIPGHGALGGLYTALREASYPIVGVVACDMPFINAELLAAEREILVSEQFDLVIPQTEKGLEPFHAVYRRDACMMPIQYALFMGDRRVDAWLRHVRQYRFPLEEIRNYDPQLLSFRNVNTPEELREAELLALDE